MLKFLRRYQKLLLSVFCVGLMIAFLVPQAAQQFVPDGRNQTWGTTGDGEVIDQDAIRKAIADINLMRRMQIDPFMGLSLIPNTGEDENDALIWTLMQRGAAANNLSASEQESFNLVATSMDADDIEALDKKAKEELGETVSGLYLVQLGKQYLMAEQYRQLVAGVEYTKPAEGEGATGSPGLRRKFAVDEARQAIQQLAQQYQQMGLQPEQAFNFASQSVLREGGYLDRIAGHNRVSFDEIRYALQREFTEVDLTVVVLDAEDRLDSVEVTDADVKALFEQYADDAPGTGEPFGLGYREPNRVKLEALRIPIDKVRELVAKDIMPEDVRAFYNERRIEYIDTTAGEDGAIATPQLTPEQRDEIAVTLTEIRAQLKVVEIAQQARLRMSEDARGLPDDSTFKALPKDFAPTPLLEIKAEIEREHGITAEIIQIDDFVSARDIAESARFTQAWINQLPTATVRIPHPQYDFLSPVPVSDIVLSGRAGLFATLVPELSAPNRGVSLADYISVAKSFIEPDSPAAALGLQAGLPGRVLSDLTRSTYVFRITQAQPSQPATDPGPIAAQLLEDARKVNAYKALVADREALLKRATELPLQTLTDDASAVNSLTGLTRGSAMQPGSAQVQGIGSTQQIVQQAFSIVDGVALTGGLDAAAEGDRLFMVESARDYKIVVARVDNVRPMTKQQFQSQAQSGDVLMRTSQLGLSADTEPAMSLEALIRYTGFKYAEGFGPDADSDDDEDGDSEDE